MKTAALIAAAISAATPAFAQANQYVGTWSCNSTYTELDQWGNRKSGFSRFYQIQISGNNTYQVQGYTPGVYGNDPFQSQGQWKTLDGGVFSAEGQEYGPNVLPGMKFVMVGQLLDGQLTSRYDMKDPSGTWIMNRSLMQCQRA